MREKSKAARLRQIVKIVNHYSVVKNITQQKNPEEVRKDLHLTFTSTADELIRRGLENEREVDF